MSQLNINKVNKLNINIFRTRRGWVFQIFLSTGFESYVEFFI